VSLHKRFPRKRRRGIDPRRRGVCRPRGRTDASSACGDPPDSQRSCTTQAPVPNLCPVTKATASAALTVVAFAGDLAAVPTHLAASSPPRRSGPPIARASGLRTQPAAAALRSDRARRRARRLLLVGCAPLACGGSRGPTSGAGVVHPHRRMAARRTRTARTHCGDPGPAPVNCRTCSSCARGSSARYS